MPSSPPPHNLISPKRPLLPPKAPATPKSYTLPLPSRAELQHPPTSTTTTTTTPRKYLDIPPPTTHLTPQAITFHARHPPQPFLDPSLLEKRRAAAQAAQERESRAGVAD